MLHLLTWYNLIFELPAGFSAILLVLSTIRIGNGHATSAGHHVGMPSGHHIRLANFQSRSHGSVSLKRLSRPSQDQSQGLAAGHTPIFDASRIGSPSTAHVEVHWQSAPKTALVGFFGLFWGAAGFICNSLLIGAARPTIGLIVESAGIAAVVGILAARGGAELLARILPPDETYDISREGLYGLVGEVAFEVTGSSGRLLVYDDHGTLHDEICRSSRPGTVLQKGCRVMIVDRDPDGHLLVEEVAYDLH